MWALKSAPQLAAFWCIRVQFAAKIALSTTNAGVRREVIGLPTNASFKAFLSGVPERYRGDNVCMVEADDLGHRCVHDQINDDAELPNKDGITTCPLMQPVKVTGPGARVCFPAA